MNIGILGGGESGIGAAMLAIAEDHRVWLSDHNKITPEFLVKLHDHNIPFEEGGHDFERLVKCDLVIKSPGVPQTAPIVERLRQAGISIISEVEWAFRHCHGQILAITGSNGKTTTIHLCHHLLMGMGVKALKGGNLGASFSRLIAERDPADWYIIELSSFQLEDIRKFRPDIAMVLNITPDHLDRYQGSFDLYAATKMRLTMNMDDGCRLLLPKGDAWIQNWLHQHRELTPELIDAEKVKPGQIILPNDETLEWSNQALAGRHNAMNLAFAIHACWPWLKNDDDRLKALLESFTNDPHRMERFAEYEGLEFTNDSKATNVESAAFALDSMKYPLVWIAGGQDKGNDYEGLKPLVKSRVVKMICLTTNPQPLLDAFGDLVPDIAVVDNCDDAVKEATSVLEKGGQILLSPACASFDLFDNYMHRGDRFKEAVMNWIKEKKKP